jgi:hypothetical protein
MKNIIVRAVCFYHKAMCTFANVKQKGTGLCFQFEYMLHTKLRLVKYQLNCRDVLDLRMIDQQQQNVESP